MVNLRRCWAFWILWAACLHGENSLESNVEIYQEHEGNLQAEQQSDVRGNFFDLYQPTVVDAAALESAIAGETWFTRQLIYLRQRVQTSRSTFDLLPTRAKIRFLETVEQKLPREKAWDGTTSLLLRKRPGAFSWLSEHPSMEAMPFQGVNEPSFWFPEVKTDRNHPARSVQEAMERTKLLIEATGLEGLHFHVLKRVSPQKPTDDLLNTLLVYNERIFLEEAERSSATALYSRLQPWQSAHTERSNEILRANSPSEYPHNFEEDPADPKGTYVALRYWGVEDGKQVVSVELRAGSADLKVVRNPPTTRGLEEGVLPVKQRDYSVLQHRLSELVKLGQLFGSSGLAPSPRRERALSLEQAEGALKHRLGAQKALSLAQFSEWILGLKTVPPGLLMAFEHPEETATQRFISDFGELARLASSAGPRENNRPFLASRFSEVFRIWAKETRMLRFPPAASRSSSKQCPLDLLAK